MLSWLGFQFKPQAAPRLGRVLGFLISLIGLAVIVGGITALVLFLGQLFKAPVDHEAIRNIGLVLVAAFSAPFVAWRATVAQKQADVAARALENERLNAAFESLAARRTVTDFGRTVTFKIYDRTVSQWVTEGTSPTLPEGATEIEEHPWQMTSREEPDIVTRSAAIDRLLGLAKELPAEAPRIASALSIYVRETTAEDPWEKNQKTSGTSTRSRRTDVEPKTTNRLRRKPG